MHNESIPWTDSLRPYYIPAETSITKSEAYLARSPYLYLAQVSIFTKYSSSEQIISCNQFALLSLKSLLILDAFKY